MDSLVLRGIHPSATLSNGVSAAKATPTVDLRSLDCAHAGYAGTFWTSGDEVGLLGE